MMFERSNFGFDTSIFDGYGIISKPSIGFDEYYRSLARNAYSSGNFSNSNYIPRITDIKVIVPGKVVECTFNNGHKQKTVCDEADTFSLEMAITICYCKEILGGTKEYNKMVRDSIGNYHKKLERIELLKLEKERAEKRRAKYLAYKQKKADREREAAIELQTEAYLRAWKVMKEIEDAEWEEEMVCERDGDTFTIDIPVKFLNEEDAPKKDDSQE